MNASTAAVRLSASRDTLRTDGYTRTAGQSRVHHSRLPPGTVQGWRTYLLGCPTCGAPLAAARQLLTLTLTLTSCRKAAPLTHYCVGSAE